MINTGDLLAGKSGAIRHEILDAMIAHWMSDPVHGTKTGYSKLAMKLAERVEADLIPKIPAKRTTSKKRAASPEAGSSGSGSSSSSRNIRGRAGLTTAGETRPTTRTARDRTQTRGAAGSPTLHAADTAAVASADAAAPATSTRASLLNATSVQLLFLSSFIFFSIVV